MTFKDTKKAKAALLSFLKSCATIGVVFESEKQSGKHLTNGDNKDSDTEYGDQEAFKKEFTKLYDAAYGREDKNISRDYDLKKINDLLQKRDLPFEIKSSHDWTVIEREKDNEN